MKKIFFLLTLILTVFAFGCQKSNNRAKTGELVVHVGSVPETIDPSITGNDFVYPRHVFEGLITKDKDGKNIGGVAEKWDISEDGKTYIFYLRKNAKWSDGKPVTTSDFVYGWQRTADPKTAGKYTSFMGYVKNGGSILSGKMPVDSLGVKAIDEYTLEVSLESPTAYFIELLTYPLFFPIRKDIVEGSKEDWTLSPKTYIGNGPFVLTDRSKDTQMIIEKNKNYWNAKSVIPNKITFIISSDQMLSIAGVKEGSIDFSNNPPEQEVATLVKEGIGYTLPYIGTFAIGINVTNSLLKDSRVRKALSLAIDRNYLTEKVVMSGQKPATAWVPPGMIDYDGKDFRENGGEFISLKKEDYAKNVEEAKKLLSEAGYPNGKGFPVLEFKTSNYLPVMQLAEAIQSMWKENLGIDMRMSVMEWAVYQSMRREKDFQIIRTTWIGDYLDPMTFFEIFIGGSSQNYTGYSNKEFDKLIHFAQTTSDRKARMEALHKAEELLVMGEGAAVIPIHYSGMAVVANPKLKGVVYTATGVLIFNYAYLEK